MSIGPYLRSAVLWRLPIRSQLEELLAVTLVYLSAHTYPNPHPHLPYVPTPSAQGALALVSTRSQLHEVYTESLDISIEQACESQLKSEKLYLILVGCGLT